MTFRMWRQHIQSGVAYGCLALAFVSCNDSQPPAEDVQIASRDSAQFWSDHIVVNPTDPVSYTHLTLPTSR